MEKFNLWPNDLNASRAKLQLRYVPKRTRHFMKSKVFFSLKIFHNSKSNFFSLVWSVLTLDIFFLSFIKLFCPSKSGENTDGMIVLAYAFVAHALVKYKKKIWTEYKVYIFYRFVRFTYTRNLAEVRSRIVKK